MLEQFKENCRLFIGGKMFSLHLRLALARVHKDVEKSVPISHLQLRQDLQIHNIYVYVLEPICCD